MLRMAARLRRPEHLYRPAARLWCTEPRFPSHPPTQEIESDVVVIGGGHFGSAAAIKAARLGLKTTCIEKRGALGGALPFKALFDLCESKHGLEINLPMAIEQRKKAAICLNKSIEGIFKKNQVNYIKGTGHFVSSSLVSVDTLEEKKVVVKGKHIIIATGSHLESSLPRNIGIDEKRIVSSAGALSLTDIPKRAVLIGASYSSLEIGSIWGRLGSEVIVVEIASDILLTMDDEIRTKFLSMLDNQSFKFMLETRVVGVDASSSSGVKLTIEPSAGGHQRTLESDVVLVPEYRVPNTEELHLEEIGIQNNDVRLADGIPIVNKRFGTCVAGVSAMGDVVKPGLMLSANRRAEDAAAYLELIITGNGEANVGNDKVPSVIYTDPGVASIGMTEEQVKGNGNLEYWASTIKLEKSEGLVKMIAEKETNKVLGVHVMAPNAEVTIGHAASALQHSDWDAHDVLEYIVLGPPELTHLNLII